MGLHLHSRYRHSAAFQSWTECAVQSSTKCRGPRPNPRRLRLPRPSAHFACPRPTQQTEQNVDAALYFLNSYREFRIPKKRNQKRSARLSDCWGFFRLDHTFWALASCLEIDVWFEFVYSEANVADWPSRGELGFVTDLEALACEMRVPPSDSWGAVESVQPTGDPLAPPRKKDVRRADAVRDLECVDTPFILWYLFGNHAVPPGLLGNPCGSSAFARPVGLVELALRGACSYPSSVLVGTA